MPAPTIEIKDAEKTVELWDTVATWNEDEHFVAAYAQLDAWNAAWPLATCKWEAQPPEGTTRIYRLAATGKDGRVWKIDVALAAGIEEPSFSFNVQARFAEREFVAQRVLRDHLIHITRIHGVTKLTATWF